MRISRNLWQMLSKTKITWRKVCITEHYTERFPLHYMALRYNFQSIIIKCQRHIVVRIHAVTAAVSQILWDEVFWLVGPLRYVHTVSVCFSISIRFSIRVSFSVRRSVHTHRFYSDEPSVFLSVSFIWGAKILAFSCLGAHGKFSLQQVSDNSTI